MVKRAAIVLIWFIGALLALVACYGLAAWAGSGVSRNGGWVEAEQGIDIYLETNEVHTSLVMPLVSPGKDWRPDFPATDLVASSAPYTHIALSWGEKEVFLNTPRWEDLRPSMVLNIALFKGEALLHAAHYTQPAASETLRPIRLTPQEYARLVAYIEAYLPQTPGTAYPGYGAQDAFYNANGTYTPLNTCNQWTSDALATAGIRTGWWTPFAGGVMKWVSPPDDRNGPVY